MPANKGALKVAVRKSRVNKNGGVEGTSLPPVLKLPLEGKIKRKDIRKAVMAVRKRRALAAR